MAFLSPEMRLGWADISTLNRTGSYAAKPRSHKQFFPSSMPKRSPAGQKFLRRPPRNDRSSYLPPRPHPLPAGRDRSDQPVGGRLDRNAGGVDGGAGARVERLAA